MDPKDKVVNIGATSGLGRAADNPTAFATQAVKEHQVLIAQEPFRYASYHALVSP